MTGWKERKGKERDGEIERMEKFRRWWNFARNVVNFRKRNERVNRLRTETLANAEM